MNSKKHINYPYMPAGARILYVSADNPYMQAAKDVAKRESLDKTMPTGSVVVKDNAIIGKGANGSRYHETNECERVKQKIPTGQGYELCEGCHPKNHSEPTAIARARKATTDLAGSDLYLWGHWWCCEPCWNSMLAAGIRTVYLMQGSEKLFNKEHPDNIVGKQFA